MMRAIFNLDAATIQIIYKVLERTRTKVGNDLKMGYTVVF